MSNDGITSLLSAILIIMVSILFVLIIVYIILRAKTKKQKIQMVKKCWQEPKDKKLFNPKL